jgi:hypothetical protein
MECCPKNTYALQLAAHFNTYALQLAIHFNTYCALQLAGHFRHVLIVITYVACFTSLCTLLW